ncbi:MAG: hypothetical protein DI573_04870 [Microbacterium sp.]|nr:MAG: hypothetical protein DI573_04870 [Microbacterium sp.]
MARAAAGAAAAPARHGTARHGTARHGTADNIPEKRPATHTRTAKTRGERGVNAPSFRNVDRR